MTYTHYDASGVPLAVGDQVELFWSRPIPPKKRYLPVKDHMFVMRIPATVVSLGKRRVTIRPHSDIFVRNVVGKSLWLTGFGRGLNHSRFAPSPELTLE